MPINFLTVLLILITVFSFIFLLTLLFFYLSGFISLLFGAPYIPLSRKPIKKILSFGGLSSNDVFFDLGCGDGRILIPSLLNFNVSRAVGYEIAPWPYLKSLFLIKYKQIERIELFRKNFLEEDFREATFIYLYLFPKLVNKIAYKIASGKMYNTKILCVEFPIDLNKHNEFKLLKSGKIDGLMVYLYVLKPRNS